MSGFRFARRCGVLAGAATKAGIKAATIRFYIRFYN
jgi:hypothetical protein